jgi:hypothetical protein
MHISRKTTAAFSLLFLVFMPSLVFAMDSKTGQINCDIQNRSCTRMVSGGSISFDIHPKPVKAMENLKFEVKIKNLDLNQPPTIDLGMPGMKMGPNQIKMERTADGVYQGEGIIVRCPSGKTLWQAIINLPGKDSVDFIFDVIY